MSFEQIFISKYNLPLGADKKGTDLSRYKIDIKIVSRIEEVFGLLFG